MMIFNVKALLEALLFASSKPVTIDVLADVSGVDSKEAVTVLEGLANEYRKEGRGFELLEIAGGYQLRSKELFSGHITNLFQKKARRRFSKSGLETLAMVAYRQPVTRAEIEELRGVDSGGVLKTLLSLDMVKVLGRKETPGRPILYGTTREFLEYFGLRDLESLPTLQEVTDILEEPAEATSGDALLEEVEGDEESNGNEEAEVRSQESGDRSQKIEEDT